MDADQLALFVETARAGSLSEAARRLGLTPAVASKRLQQLEARVRTRLMHRSTRRLALTPDGEAFLPHAQAVLDAHEAARLSVGDGRTAAEGLLRITAPASFAARVLWPLVPPFLEAHPRLRLDLQASDRVADLRAESLDAALRIAPLEDSGLVAQKLAPNRLLLCAAPAYLARAGTPASLAELPLHECLALGGASQWWFGTGRQRRSVRVQGRVRSNSNEVIRQACLDGLGIALHSHWDVTAELAGGRLVALDVGMVPTPLAVWFVYPHRRLLPYRVQAFSDHLAQALRRMG